MINFIQSGAIHLIISIYVKYSLVLIFGATKFLSQSWEIKMGRPCLCLNGKCIKVVRASWSIPFLCGTLALSLALVFSFFHFSHPK